jgi:hypothetical protein
MSKMRLLLANMLLVSALGTIAVACSAAQAADFVFEGAKEGESEKFAEESRKDEKAFRLEAEKEPTIECTKTKVVAGAVKDDSADATVKGIDFESCVDLSEKECKVPNIDTNEVEVDLEAGKTKGDTDEKFKPKSGAEIAHFKLEGIGCKETKELKIDGDFISNEEDNETLAEEHPVDVEVSAASHELEYGDQLQFAALRLELRLRAPIRWGLCLSVLC